MITIKKKGTWYDFSEVPQEHRYLKIHWFNCKTDRKALNIAKKINSKYQYSIEEI